MLLVQSESTLHIEPPPQAGHAPPPQSTSLSLPSTTRSSHAGDLQTSPRQRRLSQSSFVLQARLIGHRAQSAPPQSMSVSVSSIFPSAQ
jgi:hypothetical protein